MNKNSCALMLDTSGIFVSKRKDREKNIRVTRSRVLVF